MRLSDYIVTPADLWQTLRSMGRHDWIGAVLAIVFGSVTGLWLSDLGAGLFVAGLVAALFWRVDSRWPFGLALALLVLIPLMQLSYQRNWLFWGQAIADGMAVAVWYLLVIGVARQIAELRRTAPAAAPAPVPTKIAALPNEAKYGLHSGLPALPVYEPTPAPAAAQRTPGQPIPFHRSLRKQRMVAYRVMNKVERVQHGIDGIRPRKVSSR